MKKTVFIFAAIMAVVAASCEKARILYASVEKIEVTAKGGEGSVVLASDVEKFMVESAPEWVTTGINGNVMTYKVEENTTGALRSGDITISVLGKEMTIAVVLARLVAVLERDNTGAGLLYI